LLFTLTRKDSDMDLRARSTFVSLVGLVTLTCAQLLPSAAAAQTAAQPSQPVPQGYPPPQGYPAPPPQGYAPPPLPAVQARDGEYGRAQPTVYQRPARRSKGLLIAGPIVLGASYGLTALVGLQMMSYNTNNPGSYCENCDTAGPRLLIPVLGPWLATPYADGDDGKAVTVVLGLAQATGVILTIVGISRYAASAPGRTTAANPRGLQFALVPDRGGGLGVLGGAF
jgi:hypothetical protein